VATAAGRREKARALFAKPAIGQMAGKKIV
jgi:hypothetical protein